MNIQTKTLFAAILSFSLSYQSAKAQELINPLEIPILLSGNFGELRSNHFHSGIDFKTQGVEGKPVHSVQEGYVSRISVNPWGYGNALYISHPDGTTTVYGHLQRFSSTIAAYVKERQYEQESFSVNLHLTGEEIPVEKNEVIAFSGNTGSSGGPHLHFEVRDTESEEVLDPISYFKSKITDNKAPRIQGIMLYPVNGEGIINGSTKKKEIKPSSANEIQNITEKIEAWGKIGIAVKSYDYMDNTSNIYGVKEVELTADGQVIYRSDIDRFSFDESRYLNSLIDYEEWAENRSFYMKSFVEPGNRLSFIESKNRGIISIDEERIYMLKYTLTDSFGNSTYLSIQIEGKEQSIPEIDTESGEYFYWNSSNRFGSKGVRLTIPRGNLYSDFLFRYAVVEDSTALAATHQLHNKPLALHKNAQLSIRLQHDTLENKRQYGIVRINKGRTSWIGGEYRDGWIDGNIRELGSYSLSQDTKAPVITPLNQETWIKNQRFSFRLSDNLSGISTYWGEINGQFILFEMNNRSVITYRFDKNRLERGNHTLKLTVTDGCGNTSVYEHPFSW